jgi:hypothetical protein
MPVNRQILDIIQKLDRLVTDGAPRMARCNSGLLSLLTDDVKYTIDRDLMISHCLIHQDSLCAKLLKMAYVVPLLRKMYHRH